MSNDLTFQNGTSIGGLALIGTQGEMALTSQTNPSSGLPGQVIRYYWENGLFGDSAVLHGMGANRLSIESEAAMVHISKIGRFEFEGQVTPRLSFVGFETATAAGKTIDFTNYGQNPTHANPIVSISAEHVTDDALHIGTTDGAGGYTANARIGADGGFHAPYFQAKQTADTECRATVGLDSGGKGALTFGIGGTTAPDVILSREGTAGGLGINNGTNPAQLRIYRTYDTGGTNTEGWNLTWRFATATWASIRTIASGTGSARNMCIEPALIGIGTPTGNGSNIPALKHSGADLQIRLGDDSDFAKVQGKLTTDTNAAAGTITPDHFMVLFDAAGVAYKVPCVAV